MEEENAIIANITRYDLLMFNLCIKIYLNICKYKSFFNSAFKNSYFCKLL